MTHYNHCIFAHLNEFLILFMNLKYLFSLTGDTIYLAQEMFWKYRDVSNLIFSKELPVYSNRINKWKNLVNTF